MRLILGFLLLCLPATGQAQNMSFDQIVHQVCSRDIGACQRLVRALKGHDLTSVVGDILDAAQQAEGISDIHLVALLADIVHVAENSPVPAQQAVIAGAIADMALRYPQRRTLAREAMAASDDLFARGAAGITVMAMVDP